MAFDWTTGQDDITTIATPRFPSLRYNKIIEVPLQIYQNNSDGTVNLKNTNKFKTRYKYRDGSLKVTIDGVVVNIKKQTGQYVKGYEFEIEKTGEVDGYILVEYAPYNINDYISNNVMSNVVSPSTCVNRLVTLDINKILSVKNALTTAEYYLADRDDENYLYSHKIIFDSDIKSDISGITKEEIRDYQDALDTIVYVLNTLNNQKYTADVADIDQDISGILKDKYIYQLRYSLNQLDSIYNITNLIGE